MFFSRCIIQFFAESHSMPPFHNGQIIYSNAGWSKCAVHRLFSDKARVAISNWVFATNKVEQIHASIRVILYEIIIGINLNKWTNFSWIWLPMRMIKIIFNNLFGLNKICTISFKIGSSCVKTNAWPSKINNWFKYLM